MRTRFVNLQVRKPCTQYRHLPQLVNTRFQPYARLCQKSHRPRLCVSTLIRFQLVDIRPWSFPSVAR
jgi:hypothetical protein